MPTLHDRLLAAVTARRELAQAATPGPWASNSYSMISAGPLLRAYEGWDTGDHLLERYGQCPVCGEWRTDGRSKALGDGCQLFDEEYERDPTVAHVPSHHGDTATGRHRADMLHIEANDPAQILRDTEAHLKILELHQRYVNAVERGRKTRLHLTDPDGAAEDRACLLVLNEAVRALAGIYPEDS